MFGHCSFGIIDRRKNPTGKSLPNRQRFIEKAKQSVREAADLASKKRDINDETDVGVSVPKKGISEPQFTYNRKTGIWDVVLPGNKQYSPGDIVPRPPSGGSGSGSGGQAGADDSEDDFQFTLTYEEYIDTILDDLDLPDLVKQSTKDVVAFSKLRAGYTTTGPENNLNIVRTLISSIGRRISLRGSKQDQIDELQIQIDQATDAQIIDDLLIQLQQLKDKRRVNFIENVDLRYNSFKNIPKPKTHATMICVMDVSGSMDDITKQQAKRFYLLLYLFLKRKYKGVNIRFIRHTHVAEEVDEHTFFYSRESGGTKISTAFMIVKDIMSSLVKTDTNIYIAQATDGDNDASDNPTVIKLLSHLLPDVQFMTYLEIKPSPQESLIWAHMTEQKWPNIMMKMVSMRENIIPVFRSFFQKKGASHE